MVSFTEADLQRYGEKARDFEEEIYNNCYEICHTLGNILIDEGLPKTKNAYSVIEVRLGDNNEEHHFVLCLDGNYIEKNADWVVVDPSLDQFCKENESKGLVQVSFGERSSIPSVRIEYTDPKESKLYTSVSSYLKEELN